MLLLFVLVLVLALGSYFYLLEKADNLKKLSTNTSPAQSVSKSPQKEVMLDPKEFMDENISFFYPGVLVINDTTDDVTTWHSMISGTIVTENTLRLARQDTSFERPINIYDTKYFDIDDAQEREINDILMMEYTINCGPKCSYRIDQFKVGDVNYQLSFLIAGPGLSQRAEQILATVRTLSPKPTEPQNQKACTMEAKLCSDGSSVGRSGPNCEFSVCPSN